MTDHEQDLHLRRWSPSGYRAAMGRGVGGRRMSCRALRAACVEIARAMPGEDLPIPTPQTFSEWTQDGSNGPKRPWLIPLIAIALECSTDDLTSPIYAA